MIVVVMEHLSLSAVQVYLEPSTPPDEHKADLACLIAIPPQDRYYNPEQRIWTIYHPQRYTRLVPALQGALNLLKHHSAQQVIPFQKE
jgi:hypothetical protein